MTALEIVLLIGGLIIFAASFVVGNDEKKDNERVEAKLTEEEKEKIRSQIDTIIQEKIDAVSERTEAQIDKISNTKMLEFGDYTDAVMKEINKNHNETVFLYDMLNEKAKEVKKTVKDVNISQKDHLNAVSHSKKMQNEESENADKSDSSMSKKETEKKNSSTVRKKSEGSLNAKKNSKQSNADNNGEDENEKASRDIAKERLMNIVGAKKTAKAENYEKSTDTVVNFDRNGGNNNKKIIEMHEQGINNKDIAKSLNLGIGEVKLVVDLFTSAK